MKCLIDGDILVYEVGYASQHKEDGRLVINNFDSVIEYLEEKIKIIEGEVWSTCPSQIYLTGDERLSKLSRGSTLYSPNFRVCMATTRPYKGTRTGNKPYHYDNIRAYMLGNYRCTISNGMEADDMLSTDGYSNKDVTICSRDKDLKTVPGNHFGWSCGKQLQFGPEWVDEIGRLKYENGKLTGTGNKFFYAQVICGDSVDNIPGLPGGGKALAYKSLKDCESIIDMLRVVSLLYKNTIGDYWKEYLTEQINLLWMVRKLDKNGQPILWDEKQFEEI